eukprot:1368823-Amorphochlora_amoeboformis.AAC.3
MRWEWRQVPKVTESQLNLSYSAPVRPMTWMPFDDKTSDKIECAYGSGKERLRCRVPSLVDPDTGKKEKVFKMYPTPKTKTGPPSTDTSHRVCLCDI